ncbi:MAG: DUF2147 domain-containing protein [Chitinophagales bacterium]
MKLLLQCFLVLMVMTSLFGSDILVAQSGGDAIVGTWLVPEKDGKIKVYKKGDTYFGEIIWIAEPNNADGTPRKDIQNIDESLRSQPIVGLQVLEGFKYDAGEDEWIDGTVYNSRSGKTYSGYIKLQKDGTLYLKGFVMGMRWMGKSNVWTRVK